MLASISAERRFSILLLCALAVLVSAGVALPRYHSAEASAAATVDITRDVLPAVPIEPARPLEPLWLTDLKARFPTAMIPVLAPRASLLPQHQIVSYYGNPYSEQMGILGSDDLETVADLLEERAAQYDRLNGSVDVMPAIHLVYAVAQPHPTDNELYLQYVDDQTLQRYLDFVEGRDMLLFLDLQIGRSSVADEVQKVLPYLRRPNVHLALDPEFAVGDDHAPGEVIGSLTAEDIDVAQAMLQQLVIAERLPPKLLMVHQFLDGMVLSGHAINRHPGVELIIDMDGFGMAAVKRATYEKYAGRPYAAHAAIKLFFNHDPDLMSEREVLLLTPPPAVIVYQ